MAQFITSIIIKKAIMQLKIRPVLLFLALPAFLLSGIKAEAQQPNTLTQTQQRAGWKLLFDGKDLAGWHSYLQPDAKPGWSVADDAIKTDFNNGGVRQDLVTDDEYENYELSLEWKIAKGGNSGIIFNLHEDPAYSATYFTGLEMQVLDNVNAEDNKKDNHLAGSLYDLIAADPKAVHPFGVWNRARIRMQEGHLTLWLNGKKVVETQLWNDQWKKLVAGSKFKEWPVFGTFHKGHIALQYHGGEVWYRNIKIRQL